MIGRIKSVRPTFECQGDDCPSPHPDGRRGSGVRHDGFFFVLGPDRERCEVCGCPFDLDALARNRCVCGAPIHPLDRFAHRSELRGVELSETLVGLYVEFDAGLHSKGARAMNVRLLINSPVAIDGRALHLTPNLRGHSNSDSNSDSGS